MSQFGSMSIEKDPKENIEELNLVNDGCSEQLDGDLERGANDSSDSPSDFPEPEATHATDEPAITEHEVHGERQEKGYKAAFEDFKREIDALPDAEAKLQRAVEFMEASLGQGTTPHFKSFWDARNISLELFKENINPVLRAGLWSKYSELSKEARRLKDILDEQSAFAVEQIDIAIKALETDIAEFEANLPRLPDVDFPQPLESLHTNIDLYQEIQKKLNLLNTQASRINALRKELIKTEMRVRQKNKFFQRLSLAGDQVFPKRKELIKTISHQFSQDVDNFVKQHFTGGISESLFQLREEIKALQGMAKLLTLNTHSFTHTRLRLSECWDQIKNLEKERKKARSQQKSFFKQNMDSVSTKIAEFTVSYAEGKLSNQDALRELDEISSFMRSTELGREEVKALREDLANARKPVQDKIRQEELEREQQEQEKEKHRRQKIQELWDEVDALLAKAVELEVEALTSERDALQEKIASASIAKLEKNELEKRLKSLKDIIAEKKEKALLSLSDTDRQALSQLKVLLSEKKKRRQEIKNQIEQLRKASGSSGLDISKAMSVNTQLAAERETLEKINLGIEEIEERIDELESGI